MFLLTGGYAGQPQLHVSRCVRSPSSPPWGTSTQKQACRKERKRRAWGEGNGAHVCISARDKWGKAQFKLLLEFTGLGNFTIWNSIQCKLGGFKIAWTPLQYRTPKQLQNRTPWTSSHLSSTLAKQPVQLGLPAGPCRTLFPSLALIPKKSPLTKWVRAMRYTMSLTYF